MARLVLSDASPLIGLAIVGGLDWLRPLFGVVWVPPTVLGEVLPGVGARGEKEIHAALGQGGLQRWTEPIPAPRRPLPDLDAGETERLHVALANGAQQTLVLMDERAGRAVAAENGVRVAGTAALIGLARRRGLIDAAKPRFAQLHATDFRIGAAVIQQVLREVGEA
jgi:predicted nucleic acid-binding protein